jgi:hypothetical protein
MRSYLAVLLATGCGFYSTQSLSVDRLQQEHPSDAVLVDRHGGRYPLSYSVIDGQIVSPDGSERTDFDHAEVKRLDPVVIAAVASLVVVAVAGGIIMAQPSKPPPPMPFTGSPSTGWCLFYCDR